MLDAARTPSFRFTCTLHERERRMFVEDAAENESSCRTETRSTAQAGAFPCSALPQAELGHASREIVAEVPVRS
jgi:hypothetical protein